MNNSALQRERIEDLLSARIPSALTPRQHAKPDRMACGNSVLDELLAGGIAVGCLTEFVGQNGSGRTTAAFAYLAAATSAGGVCAWVDATDALDPETVAASGILLGRLLWVRCGAWQAPASAVSAEPSQAAPVSISLAQPQPRHTGGGSLHPRSEGRHMHEAISAMLHSHGGFYDHVARKEARIGTPGASNRPLPYRSEHPEEQVNSDRLPPRRGDNLNIVALAPRCAEPQSHRIASVPTSERLAANLSPADDQPRTGTSPWKALDQALRATDLLLQGGGFTTIVLDLGNVAPEFAWRIPLATWFRFRAACERSRTSLLLLTQHPCSRSSADAVVRMQPGHMEAQNKVMTGIRYQATTERSRALQSEDRVVPIRKPPQPERMRTNPGQWASNAVWMQAG